VRVAFRLSLAANYVNVLGWDTQSQLCQRSSALVQVGAVLLALLVFCWVSLVHTPGAVVQHFEAHVGFPEPPITLAHSFSTRSGWANGVSSAPPLWERRCGSLPQRLGLLSIRLGLWCSRLGLWCSGRAAQPAHSPARTRARQSRLAQGGFLTPTCCARPRTQHPLVRTGSSPHPIPPRRTAPTHNTNGKALCRTALIFSPSTRRTYSASRLMLAYASCMAAAELATRSRYAARRRGVVVLSYTSVRATLSLALALNNSLGEAV